MNQPLSPDDRPDPNDRQPAVRARVPDHIHRGVFSTGAIVMTGPNEFVIDFVQNLGRPFQVVARVVLPHAVMPQFVDALGKNIDLFRQRFGPLPTVQQRAEQIVIGNAPISPAQNLPAQNSPAQISPAPSVAPSIPPQLAQAAGGSPSAPPGTGQPPSAESGASGASGSAGIGQSGGSPDVSSPLDQAGATNQGAIPNSSTSGSPPAPRRLSPQEVYDELKLRDDVLSGNYANAVMIGHGPYEFSFDFITNFYPQSAVSARVFVSSGQVGLLYDSLKTTWEQFKPRFPGQFPQDPPPPNSWE